MHRIFRHLFIYVGNETMLKLSITDPICSILDPGLTRSRIRINIEELSVFNPKDKFSKIRSGMFILGPRSCFFPSRVPDPGFGSGSATLSVGWKLRPQHPFAQQISSKNFTHKIKKAGGPLLFLFRGSRVCWRKCHGPGSAAIYPDQEYFLYHLRLVKATINLMWL